MARGEWQIRGQNAGILSSRCLFWVCFTGAKSFRIIQLALSGMWIWLRVVIFCSLQGWQSGLEEMLCLDVICWEVLIAVTHLAFWGMIYGCPWLSLNLWKYTHSWAMSKTSQATGNLMQKIRQKDWQHSTAQEIPKITCSDMVRVYSFTCSWPPTHATSGAT